MATEKEERLRDDIKYYTEFIKENYDGKDIDLLEIEKNIPEMKKLGVSHKARSREGFINAFREAGSDLEKLPDDWKLRRLLFLARSIPQYFGKQHTRRRALSLIAWAWMPNDKIPEHTRRLRRKQGIKKDVKKEKQEETKSQE